MMRLKHTKLGILFIFCALSLTLIGCKTRPALTRALANKVNTEEKFKALIKEGLAAREEWGAKGGILENDVSVAAPGADGPSAPERDFTGTNEQVAGVSESDLIKTDGYTIYYLAQDFNELQIFDVKTDLSIALKKTISFPEMYLSSMYLLDDYVLLLGMKYHYYNYFGLMCDMYSFNQETIVTLIDRETLEIAYDLKIFNTNIIDHRVIDNTLFLVGSQSFYGDNAALPTFSDTEEAKVLSYSDIYYLDETPVVGMTTLIGVKIDENVDNIFYTAEGYLGTGYSYKQLYVTPTDLYISDTNYNFNEDMSYQTMTISQFGLNVEMATMTFVAAGLVDGGMLNQFSMDFYDGYLRVATTNSKWIYNNLTMMARQEINNHLYVLKVNTKAKGFMINGHLTKDLGKPNESIYSVRFNKDKAYIVTFLRTDPLYVIDLSNPREPVITDAVILPGFDTYQHPWGDSYLVGLGQSASESGFANGMKMTAYDVTSGSAKEMQTLKLSTDSNNGTYYYTYSEALYNHKASLISVKDGVWGFALNSYSYREISEPGSYGYEYKHTNSYNIYAIDFSKEAPISLIIEVEHPVDEGVYNNLNRSVLIEGNMYIFSSYYVSVYNLETGVLSAPIATHI